MAHDKIIVHGARAHNLKNIDIEIPREKMVVITGVSGSGKSSLAFDTLFAEGQRRYVESLSSYARQFLGQMEKPDVDSIDGLSPAISIDQKTTNRNPRSTVGTVTEIHDYLRLMYARVGIPICPNDGTEISTQSAEQMVEELLALPERTKMILLSPVVEGKKGQHKKVFEKIMKDGFVRVLVDGETYDVAEVPELDKNKKHDIAIVVDRLVLKEGVRTRLTESIETSLALSNGYVEIDVDGKEKLRFSEHFSCPLCGFTIGELEPRLFSFNAPYGACEACDGLGNKLTIDLDLVIPNDSLTLREGAIVPFAPKTSDYYFAMLEQASAVYGFDLDTPWKKMPKAMKQKILYDGFDGVFRFHYIGGFGETDRSAVFEGAIPTVERRYKETSSDFIRESLTKYMRELSCAVCHGKRLNEKALAVKVGSLDISEMNDFTIQDALSFIQDLKLTEKSTLIAQPILKEIKDRLTFLNNVGLDYLSLSRSAGTLSGGEAQRIRLATQIGSSLSGIMYVLDEPSIGLHQRDNHRLIESLKKMRDLGNTLIVVEHDEDTMRESDYLIDVGPKAGHLGGEIIASGTPEEVAKNPNSLTGQYLSGKKSIPVPSKRRKTRKGNLEVIGASQNNLKNIDVKFPLGRFIAVTGVSGSGKSTLVNQVLKKSIAQKLYKNSDKPGKHKEVKGIEKIEKLIDIDQSPIGRTPRSNPATYTSVFDDIRDLFAKTNEAKIRGYQKGRFSFNVKGGRCETCRGDGVLKIEMNFLPDIEVPCDSCHGKRYNSETLEVKYKGKSIADILEMTVDDAVEFFAPIPKIHRKIETIQEVGLGYIQLGQSATTLSGGEAQRMKLASELHKKSDGKSLYILDEPTTGLHTDDIARLIQVLDKFVEQGNTVVVIEHNLDVIKSVDYVIDIGYEGGERGGEIIATGTPEEIAATEKSYTGQYLKPVLKGK